MKKTLVYIFLILVLSIPTFWRMLRPGMFSVQDSVHYFRLVEFDKCIKDWQFPCRWSPDSGLGYGEPVFNFYGQLPYAVGEIFHLVGFPFIDSLKLLFIISLAGSVISMFFLAKHLWKDNWAAIVSSMIYLYAPYRALDVWVRGALPEAMAFILFPLIILLLDKFFEKINKIDLLWFSFLIFLLIITHNLSFVMFLPLLVGWIAFRLLFLTTGWNVVKSDLCKPTTQLGWMGKAPRRWPDGLLRGGWMVCALLLALLMSSFYTLPVIFESKYINIESTIQGYFNFRGHFASLSELLFSRFWGYGASLFQATDMSRSVGQVQWVLPIVAMAIWLYPPASAMLKALRAGCYIVKKLRFPLFAFRYLLFAILMGWFYLFLTHNQSTFIWEIVKPMAYIQFPWRFLGMAVFCFALISGGVVLLFSPEGCKSSSPLGWMCSRKVISVITIIIVILLNFSFFKEDIWRKVSDRDLLTGANWEEMQRASISDFWPKYGEIIPQSSAPKNTNEATLLYQTNSRYLYEVNADNKQNISLPVNYFPGWKAAIDNKRVGVSPDKNGLISVNVPIGKNKLLLYFTSTPVRVAGNLLSLVGFYLFGIMFIKLNRK